MTVLPAPTYDGNRRRWRVSVIINFEREHNGICCRCSSTRPTSAGSPRPNFASASAA